jgi:TonB family protein
MGARMTGLGLPAGALVLGAALASSAAGGPLDDDRAPVRLGGSIQEPRKVENVAPEYPADARRAGLAGRVVLECTIDREGKVTEAVVKEGVPPLSEAAVRAVKRWRYTPTLLDGAAVPVIMTVTLDFKMTEVRYSSLLGSLDHRNEHIREAAARNLGSLRLGSRTDPGLVRKAIRALEPVAQKDESPRVRAAAAEALSRLDGRAVPADLAALVPAPQPVRTAVAWGTFVNPTGENAVEEHGERIVFSVPAGRRDLAVETGPIGAPRLVKPVEGDFDAEVRVDALPAAGLPVLGQSYHGAGIVLWQDERNYARLESAAHPSETAAGGSASATGDVRYALFEARVDGRPVGGLARAEIRLDDSPADLRMQRRGRELLGFVRQGGGEWRPVGRFDLGLAPALEIGLAAVNIGRSDLEIGLEGFAVSPVREGRASVPADEGHGAGDVARPAAEGTAAADAPKRGDASGLPARAFDYDSPPRPIRITKPEYPAEAFYKKLEGTVVLEILIDTEGRVAKSRIIQSVPGLDEAALACVRDWTFTPAMRHGHPVATIAHAPIQFRIFGKKDKKKQKKDEKRDDEG